MFEEWGFLITEMVLLIILAALLGLLVGWIIWGRKGADGSAEVSDGVAGRLRTDLEKCNKAYAASEARVAALQDDLSTAQSKLAAAGAAPSAPSAAAAAPETVAEAERDYDGDGVVEGTAEGTKPATLDAPRGGVADDLKMIKGIGPKLEQLCNRLGFYHFDQIAAWSADEVAWVDANLEGFKGRVSRDSWVDQARTLAAGGSTEFSDRVKDGDVYE